MHPLRDTQDFHIHFDTENLAGHVSPSFFPPKNSVSGCLDVSADPSL